MQVKKKSAVVIGGSAGSIPVVGRIISSLPAGYPLPVIICVHRLKSVSEGMVEVFSTDSKNRVVEPNDKDALLPGHIYIAPSNYHLLIAPDHTFCLSTEDLVNYSRPSIDVTLMSAAKVYKTALTGVLLTGANKDGAAGMLAIRQNGGLTLVQDPQECAVPYMPQAAIQLKGAEQILSTADIISQLLKYQ